MKQARPFPGEQHLAFVWPGGAPAALLVHGFPGTPAEMRPLAASLHRDGWTVQGLLLPGFGPEIETLGAKDQTDWTAAIEAALADLQRRQGPVLLVGYSMGAALVLQVAAARPPAGLVLIAPFRQLGSWRQRLAGTLLKPFFRYTRPFARTDFADPEARRNIAHFFGDIDLDDPETQQVLRDLKVPLRVFEQLNRAGRAGYRSAPAITIPSLVVQGAADEIVPRQHTRDLLRRLPGLLTYVELAAGHDLLDPEKKSWPAVEKAVLSFTRTIVEPGSDGDEWERQPESNGAAPKPPPERT